jgi:CDP-diacylglycerol---glycerol-3-phosphate 3-phosphatidyltransferase
MATMTPRHPPVFNLPNQLTASRFALGLVLFAFIALEWWLGCIVIFAAAAVTDWLDGYFARKQGLTSTLGRVLDPLVDKVLIGGAYIFLLPVPGSGLVAWMVTLVVARELVITGLRSFMENRGGTFGADWLGKIKMVLQCAALIVVLAVLWLQKQPWIESWRPGLWWVQSGLIYAMLIATVLSGGQYILKAVRQYR